MLPSLLKCVQLLVDPELSQHLDKSVPSLLQADGLVIHDASWEELDDHLLLRVLVDSQGHRRSTWIVRGLLYAWRKDDLDLKTGGGLEPRFGQLHVFQLLEGIMPQSTVSTVVQGAVQVYGVPIDVFRLDLTLRVEQDSVTKCEIRH